MTEKRVTITISENDALDVQGPGLNLEGVELVLLRALAMVQRKQMATEILVALASPRVAVASRLPGDGGRG